MDVAYAAVRAKINLDSPDQSRLVVRLRDEFHNCWTDCATAANIMLGAIQDFADGVPLTQVDPSLVISKALTLYDGTVASGGNRFDNAAIALYEFKTGTGSVAYDTSGVEPALNLTLSGAVTWVGGWGIDVRGGKAQGTTASSRKLHDLIKATGEYSIEAWVAPANVVQEDAYIVSYSGGTMARNFTLGQTMYNYDFFNRATTTDANGEPALSTPSADEVLQATLQHVVATYDPVDGRRIYVNGELRTMADPTPAGLFTDWDDTFAFVLGNEVSNDRTWQGVFRLVAIHNRALTHGADPAELRGRRRREVLPAVLGHAPRQRAAELRDVRGQPVRQLLVPVRQADLHQPRRQPGPGPDPHPRPAHRRQRRRGEGRPGLRAARPHGHRSRVRARDGLRLAGIGTVVALEKGPAADEFFLTFEQIGSNSHAFNEPVPTPLPPPPDAVPSSEIGLRTFEEISTSMSNMTGVPTTNPRVADTYNRVREQLPTVENIESFLSSHQVGVAQLSIEYCNELVDDAALRAAYFPGFNFGASAATAFDTPAERAQISGPLIARAVGTGLATQPSAAEISTEVDALIGRLTACGAGCAADRTEVVVKAACSAVIGSASTLLQ